MNIKTLLGTVRFSYPKLFEPDKMSGKYSMQLLIPKDDKELVDKIKKALEATKKAGADKLGKDVSNINLPLHDGDGKKPRGGEYGEECRGHYVMNVSTNRMPQVVVGKDRTPAGEYDLKPGDYGLVTVTFYPYNKNGNKGIGAGLNNVWKTKDGEPLGGGFSTAEDDFSGLDTNKIEFDIADVDPLTGAPIDNDFSEIL